MRGDLIKAEVVCTQMIPSVSKEMAASMKLQPHHKSLGFITGSIDDVTFISCDEATKGANVEVVYGECTFSALNAPYTKLAGEAIVVFAGPNPAEVESALEIAKRTLESDNATFVSANEDDSTIYLAHCISGVGSYLGGTEEVPEGTSMAYCIAPPVESFYGVDAAVKAADVTIVKQFFPPLNTCNFAGALMIGTQSACKAACEAFGAAVERVANNPIAV